MVRRRLAGNLQGRIPIVILDEFNGFSRRDVANMSAQAKFGSQIEDTINRPEFSLRGLVPTWDRFSQLAINSGSSA